MPFPSLRGAIAAAAMLLGTLCGAAPSAAWAEAPGLAPDTAPVVRAATPVSTGLAPAMSGSAWIAQGTLPAPGAVPPVGVAHPVAMALATGALQVSSLSQLVGDMPIDSQLTPELKCLAQAVYFEARGEPIEGQLAVAEVVINRAKSGLYPTSYCDVITQPAQFSFVRHGQIPTADESCEAWERAEAIAEIAERNLWHTQASDALYFHATYVRPSWARQKVELAQIDSHIFYR
jgi:hypothetical protein